MKKLRLLFPIALCFLSITFIYGVDIQEDLSKNLLRMHVIANSNSEMDQNIKLEVRNEVLKNMTEFADTNALCETANRTLLGLGASYLAQTKIEQCYVPEKEYKNVRLPEGIYTCVKVVLGSGEGENWWCVAYPPLCFTEEVFGDLSEEGKKYLAENLDREALDTIIKNGDINFRFKIVEMIQKLRFC